MHTTVRQTNTDANISSPQTWVLLNEFEMEASGCHQRHRHDRISNKNWLSWQPYWLSETELPNWRSIRESWTLLWIIDQLTGWYLVLRLHHDIIHFWLSARQHSFPAVEVIREKTDLTRVAPIFIQLFVATRWQTEKSLQNWTLELNLRNALWHLLNLVELQHNHNTKNIKMSKISV